MKKYRIVHETINRYPPNGTVHIFDTSTLVKERKMKKYVVEGEQTVLQLESDSNSLCIEGLIKIWGIEAKNKTEAKKIFRERCSKFEGLKVANLTAYVEDEQ